MTKVIPGMSVSLDVIVGPEPTGQDWQSFQADADNMALFTAILGWPFPLPNWREQQGQQGGENSVGSRVWAQESGSARRSPAAGCSTTATRTGARSHHSTDPSSR